MHKDMQPIDGKNNKKQILFRPRVNELLAEAAEHALVTVTAGTGYGKSRAVSLYLEHSQASYIWLQLTGLDNYTTRFWDNFAQAMQSKNQEFASQMEAMGFPDTMEKVYQFLRSFAASVRQRGHFVLVLDDFHKIEDPSIISFIETLSFARIEKLTIILITRYPLLIDYSGLKSNKLYANISVADLRFTFEETREYFQQEGHNFTDNVLKNIYASTEGWPLAIYLISLHRAKHGSLFNDPIECTIPLLYSLMEVELYGTYPEEIQNIFVRLSLMESIPVDLVKRLSGRLYADLMTVLRQNMFVHYNPQTEQYYFHRLFRLFLEEKQVRFSGEELARTYLTVGDWHNENGNRIEALLFYKKCRAYTKMWDLIRRYSLIEDIAAFCLGLMDDFPPEFLEANPECQVMRAHLVLVCGEIELAHQSFLAVKEEYESLALNDARKRVLGEAYIGLAFTSIMKSDYAFADYYMKAYEYLPDGSVLIQPKQAYVGNNAALVLFETERGALEKMVDLLFHVMPYATKAMNGCGFGVEYLAAAEACMYKGELQAATEYAHQAIYHAQQKRQHDIVHNCFSILGRTCFATGDYEGCITYLQQIRQQADRGERTLIYGLEDMAAGWFFVKVERPDLIEGWLAADSASSKANNEVLAGREKIVQAYVLMQRGEYYELLALIDLMQKLFAKRSQRFLIIHTYLLKCVCFFRLGNQDEALESFCNAYELAYPNNLVLIFWEFGDDIREVIGPLRERLVAKALDMKWIDSIYEKAGEFAQNRMLIEQEYARHSMYGSEVLPDLSGHEQQVLKALCKGLAREEIATAFGVTVSAVKNTLNTVYSKLGAINRVDAIRIATESHLV